MALHLGLSSGGSSTLNPTEVRRRTSDNHLSHLQFQQQQQQHKLKNHHIKRLNLQHENRLSHKWREVQGADNWYGLLARCNTSSSSSSFDDYQIEQEEEEEEEVRSSPRAGSFIADEELRAEIIKYGEFSQVCYDAFNNAEDSHLRGSCNCTPSQLLRETPGYEVTRYLYATAHMDLPSFFARPSSREEAWSNDSNWMGYVAVSTSEEEIARLGRREIVIAWRGTVTGLEWLQNLQDFLRPTGLDPSDKSTVGVKVESGFLNMYTSTNPRSRYNKLSARQQVLTEVKRLVEKYRGEELSITVTGHSLGGALALLSAYDIAELELNRGVPTTVVSFSAPRVGNRMFASRCRQLNVRALRVINKRDLVPKVPGLLFNEHHPLLSSLVEKLLPWTYTHFGTEIALDTADSPYLRRDGDLVAQHNLEALLHLVDGYRGPWSRFRPSGRRDIALVNKDSDLLVPGCGIPGFWNKTSSQKGNHRVVQR